MANITTATKLADMQIPESWAAYTAQRSVEQDQFFQSGVIRAVPNLASQLAGGGFLVNMPYFKPLADDAPQIPDDNKDIELHTVQTAVSQAREYGMDQGWSATDLAAELAGADPMAAISNSISDYWRHINEKILLKTLDGVFGSGTMSNINQFNATDGRRNDHTFSLQNFNAARFQLGDRYRDLAVVAVHSDVLQQLQNANIVDQKTGNTILVNGSQLPTQIQAPNPGDTIKGVRIVVDDSLPVKDGVYTSYLFATGAFGWSELPADHAVETGRDGLRFHGVDYLINRRRFILAPAGMSWNESAYQMDKAAAHTTAAFPTLDDLGNAKYWNRVADPKLIPFVKFTTTADPIQSTTTTPAPNTPSSSAPASSSSSSAAPAGK